MKPFLRTGVSLLALAGIGAGLIVSLGLVPIKASSGHWGATEWLLHFAMKRSVATHSLGIDAPDLTDERLVLIGAGHYEGGCRFCHGAPGHPLPVVPRNATPAPPDLSRIDTRYDPAELFYIVRHGIKFTAMPAWPASGRDDEVWAVVAFLRVLPELTPRRYRALVFGESEDSEPRPGGAPEFVVERCARCHGLSGRGRGQGAFPRLAHQKRRYLRASLEAFASGERPSGIMQPIAAELTPQQMTEAAEWYARQEPEATAMLPAPIEHERGKSIAQSGIPARRIPPCSGCHGPAVHVLSDAYPTLDGQPVDYLRQQLKLFAKGTRGGTAYAGLMQNTAVHALTDAELEAVVSLYAGLPRR